MLSSGFLSSLRCGLSSTGSLTRLSRPATFRNTFRIYRQLSTETIAQPNARLSLFAKGAGAASVAGLGISAYLMMKPSVFCEPIVTKEPTRPPPPDELPPPPPGSAVSLYELSFGTVAGICAGVFIKKGAKAAAFLLGGIFVLLQYFVSFSVIKVDWGRMATRFENLFSTTDATGARKSPTIYVVFGWLVNFLTADFQSRASFVAGLALGLRIG